MKLEYDAKKNRTNKQKHGVSLSKAKELFDAPTVEWIDDREDYGETRIICLGLIGTNVCCCVYTDKGDVRRIISLRNANKVEINVYFQEVTF